MPPLPYSQGVPSVEPQVGVPDNYLRIQSTPAEFGGLIGQGEQALGAGALKAHQFYSEVAADSATNQYMEGARKIIYGDPDKPWLDASGQPILDNDGKTQPDRGLIGLQGDQAMRAGPQKIKELDDLRKQLGATLLTGDSQLKFDAETRRMQSYHNTQIGAHIENESQKWAGEVEAARANNHKLAIGQAAASGDWNEVARHEQDLIGAYAARASRLGGGNDLLSQASNRGKIESAIEQIRAVAPTDPQKAQELLEKYRPILAGAGNYDALSNAVRGYVDREDREYDKAFVNQWLHDPNTPYNPPSGRYGGMPGGAPVGPPVSGPASIQQISQAAVKNGADPLMANAFAGIESSHGATPDRAGSKYQGIFQLGPDERQKAGGSAVSKGSVEDQIEQGTRWIAELKGRTARLLGREPENWEVYMTHQQGPAGFPALAVNRDKLAVDVVPAENITGNPDGATKEQVAKMTAGQFLDLWRDRYNREEAQYRGAASAVPMQQTAGGQAAQAQPIPSGSAAPQSTAVATARPDLENSINQIEAGPFPDDVKNKLISAIRRQDSLWRLTHASDLRQLREDISNTTAALAAGKDVPPIPEDRIRTYAPNPVTADDWIEKQADAREIGQAFNNAKTMSLAEMGQTQARLDAAAAVPGIHDFRLRQRQAQLFQQARSKIIEGMVSDPVDYLSGNNETIATDQESLRQLHSQANTPEGAAAYQAANTKYFGDLQAAQESFGLPDSMHHVLSKNEAQGQAQTLMTNPVQAPAAMRDMAQSYGAAWPAVWKDLVTVGKLPVAFQAAGILDDHFAMRLAEGLRDEIGTEGKKGMQVWDALLGQQRVSGISGIVNSVRSNPQMTPFLASMRTGRASVPEMDSFMHAVTTTALSLVAHEGLEDSDAVAKAVEAFTGLYGYMPNGGARVPIKQFENVASAADAAAEHWSSDTIHFPVGIADHPGAPTKEDYLANLKAHPTWINGHDQIELIDSYGRHVLGADGQPIAVSFGVAAPAVPRGLPSPMRAGGYGGF